VNINNTKKEIVQNNKIDMCSVSSQSVIDDSDSDKEKNNIKNEVNNDNEQLSFGDEYENLDTNNDENNDIYNTNKRKHDEIQ
jgi:hypothetical protein